MPINKPNDKPITNPKSLSDLGFSLGATPTKRGNAPGADLLQQQQGDPNDYRGYFKHNTPINFDNTALLNEVRAQNQSGWGLIGKSTAHVIGSELIGGTISGFGTLLDPRAWLNLVHQSNDGFEGNLLTHIGEGIKQGVDSFAPIYQTQAAQQGFALGDATWWATMVPTVASSASALIPTMAVSKAASKIGNAMKIGLKMSNSAKLGTEIISNAIMSRHIDGFQSAAQTYQNRYNKYKELGYSDEESREAAGDDAAKAYRFGYANLAFDIVQWKFLLGAKGLQAGVLDEGVAKAMLDKKLLTQDGFMNILKLNKKSSFGKTLAVESFTEGADEMMTDFYQKEGIRYNPMNEYEQQNKDNEGDIVDRLGTHISSDRSTWDSFFWGAMGGSGMMAISSSYNALFNRHEKENAERNTAAIIDRATNIRSGISSITNFIKDGNLDDAKVAQAKLLTELMQNASYDGGFNAYKQMLEDMANMNPKDAESFGLKEDDIASAKLLLPDFYKAQKIYDTHIGKNYGGLKPEDDHIIGLNLARNSFLYDVINDHIDELKGSNAERDLALNKIKTKFNLPNEFNVNSFLEPESKEKIETITSAFGNPTTSSYIDSVVNEYKIKQQNKVIQDELKRVTAAHAMATKTYDTTKSILGKERLKKVISQFENVSKDLKEQQVANTQLINKHKTKQSELRSTLSEEQVADLDDSINIFNDYLNNDTDIKIRQLNIAKETYRKQIDTWSNKTKRQVELDKIHQEYDEDVKKKTDSNINSIKQAKTESDLDNLDKDIQLHHKKDIEKRRKEIQNIANAKAERNQQLLEKIKSKYTRQYNIDNVSDEDINNNIISAMNNDINSNNDINEYTDADLMKLYAKHRDAELSKYTKEESTQTDQNANSNPNVEDNDVLLKSSKTTLSNVIHDVTKLQTEIANFNKIATRLRQLRNDLVKENPNVFTPKENIFIDELLDTMDTIYSDLDTVSKLISQKEITEDEKQFIAKTLKFVNKYNTQLNKITKLGLPERGEALIQLVQEKMSIDSQTLMNLANTALKFVVSETNKDEGTQDELSESQRLALDNLLDKLNRALSQQSKDIDVSTFVEDLKSNINQAVDIITAARQYMTTLVGNPVVNLSYDDILKTIYDHVDNDQFIKVAKALKNVFNVIETAKQNNTSIPEAFKNINTIVTSDPNTPSFVQTWKNINYPFDANDNKVLDISKKHGLSIYLHSLKEAAIPESGIVDEETAKLISAFNELTEGDELILYLKPEHEDSRYEDKEARNKNVNTIPIAIKTKSGVELGFINEAHESKLNIVYYKAIKHNKTTKFVYDSFVNKMTNKDRLVLSDSDNIAILRSIWLNSDYKDFDNLPETHPLKVTINKMIYTNRLDDNKEINHDQIRHVISPVFYKIRNDAMHLYNPSTTVIQNNYDMFNNRMKSDFDQVKRLRESFVNDNIKEMTVHVSSIGAGQMKFVNGATNRIQDEIKPIDGKIIFAFKSGRQGATDELYMMGSNSKTGKFIQGRRIKVYNKEQLTGKNYVIVEQNGRYYAQPIRPAKVGNTKLSYSRGYNEKLMKHLATTMMIGLQESDANSEGVKQMFNSLSKYIRISSPNKNDSSKIDRQLIFYPMPDGKSNIVFESSEMIGTKEVKVYYKIEQNSAGYKLSKASDKLTPEGKLSFKQVLDENGNARHSFDSFIKVLQQPISGIRRTVDYKKNQEGLGGIEFKHDESEFIDDVTGKVYKPTDTYTAYEQFLLETGALSTNITSIKNGSQVVSSFFPTGTPKATLFVDINKPSVIQTNPEPKVKKDKPKKKEPVKVIEQPKVQTTDRTMKFKDFIDLYQTSGDVEFQDFEFMHSIMESFGIDPTINIKTEELNSTNNPKVHADIQGNVITLYRPFNYIETEEGINKIKDGKTRALIIVHEVLHKVINNKLDQLTTDQQLAFNANVDIFINQLETKLGSLNTSEQGLIKMYIDIARKDRHEAFTYAFTNPNIMQILNKIEGREKQEDSFLYKLLQVVLSAVGINNKSQLMDIYNLASKYFGENAKVEDIKSEVKTTEEIIEETAEERKARALKLVRDNMAEKSIDIDYNNSESIIQNYRSDLGLHLC